MSRDEMIVSAAWRDWFPIYSLLDSLGGSGKIPSISFSCALKDAPFMQISLQWPSLQGLSCCWRLLWGHVMGVVFGCSAPGHGILLDLLLIRLNLGFWAIIFQSYPLIIAMSFGWSEFGSDLVNSLWICSYDKHMSYSVKIIKIGHA